MEAHLTNASKADRIIDPQCRYVLKYAITVDGRRTWLPGLIRVHGKAEARQEARKANARPWNF